MLSHGKVVQEGKYDLLVASPGPFQELVKHQKSFGSSPPTPDLKSEIKLDYSAPRVLRVESSGEEVETISEAAIPLSTDALEKGDADPQLSSVPKSSLIIRSVKAVFSQWRFFIPGLIFAVALAVAFPVEGWLTGKVVATFTIRDDNARLRRETNTWSFWFFMIAIIASSVVAGKDIHYKVFV